MENSTTRGADSITYVRLTPRQSQLVEDRINSDRSLNLTKIAKELGVTRGMLHYIRNGAHRTREDRVRALIERLNIDPHLFFS